MKDLLRKSQKKIGGVRTTIPVDLALIAIRGITRLTFAQWLERENKPKDYNPPVLDKFEGNSDPITHLLQFRQKMTLDMPSEAIMSKLFATTLLGRALTWFSKLPERSIENFE